MPAREEALACRYCGTTFYGGAADRRGERRDGRRPEKQERPPADETPSAPPWQEFEALDRALVRRRVGAPPDSDAAAEDTADAGTAGTRPTKSEKKRVGEEVCSTCK